MPAGDVTFRQSLLSSDARSFWGETMLDATAHAKLVAHAGLVADLAPGLDERLHVLARLSDGAHTAASLRGWRWAVSARRSTALRFADGSALEFLFVAYDPVSGRAVFLGEYAYG